MLGAAIARLFQQPLGHIELGRFWDGKIKPILQSPIQHLPVVIVQSTYPPAEHIIELCLMIDAAKQGGASKVIVVAPYLGYMRQDPIHEAASPLAATLHLNTTWIACKNSET